MAYTVADIKVDWESALHGTSLDDVSGQYELMYRAAKDCQAEVDFLETKRVQQIPNALYDRVYDYIAPSDLKKKKVIDVRPQAVRHLNDNFIGRDGKSFDLYKSNNSFNVEMLNGIKFMRISKSLTPGTILHACDNLTSDGTWATGGVATNIALDTLYFVAGNGSIRFDLSGSGAGYIENPGLTPVIDLTSHLNISSLFAWLFIQANPTALTSVELRWGSSSTNYWYNTVTSNSNQGAFAIGQNLLRFDWSNALKIGAPDVTKINYLRLTLNWTGGAQTTFRVDNIMSILPTIYEMVYYSRYLFQNSAGTYIEKPSADTDVLVLESDGHDVYLTKLLELTALQLQKPVAMRGKMINFDFSSNDNMFQEAKSNYVKNYRSEAIRTSGVYYRRRGSR